MLVIIGAPSVMVNVTGRLPVPAALVAESVEINVPVVVGVPEITPVVVSKVRPDGSVDELKFNGLLLPIIV